MEYIVDSYYGLIYDKNKADIVNKYQTDEIRFLRYNTRKILCESKASLVDSLYIHPVGNNCCGNCTYCMNHSYDKIDESKFLSTIRYQNFLQYLIDNKRLSNDISISMSGGEPVLSNNFKDYIDISVEKLHNIYSLTTCTGLFYNDNILNKFINTYYNISNNTSINNVNLSFSVDIDGSLNRFSKNLNIYNSDNFSRCLNIIPDILKNSNINCSFNIRLNNDSDINKIVDNIHKIFNISKDIVIRLSIVDDKIFHLSQNNIKYFFDILKNEFNLSFTHKGSFTLEITDKSKNMYNNLMLMEIDDGIYMLHPLDQSCWTWSKYLGIGPDRYFACFFGFYESDDIEDILQINESNKFKDIYNKLPEDCLNCELLPFCKLCKKQRLEYTCSEVPAIKEYMKEIFKIMISDPEKWYVE